MTHTHIELEALVQQWAADRQIIPNSTPVAQARKTLEEAGELLEAAARLDALRGPATLGGKAQRDYYQAIDDYADAVGDTLVTLIIGAALADVAITDCLQQAYNTIKDRKGYLRADGIFVKEA